MTSLNRREFLNTASVLTAGGVAASLTAHLYAGEDEKPKERPPVKLAIMGVNSRGKQLLPGFVEIPEIEIAYICDPDSDTIPSAVKIVQDGGKPTPRIEKDFRVALDDPSVTALVCAAPDHWHALATILACQAGKDVYVEKPCCHNPLEGQRMVAAARRYNRVVQVGTQRRSGLDMQALVKEVQGGRLGKVNFVRCWITSTRPNIGHEAPSAPPSNLDFNLWCGPGPDKSYKKNLVHYHWHWRWDYGTGECGNNGIHALDIARWGLGIEFVDLVTCGGGKYFFDDDQETPDTQLATFEVPGACIQWEHRTWSPRGIDGEGFGVAFYGSQGTLVTNGRGWVIYEGTGKNEKVAAKHDGSELEKAHKANFLDCIASRERPNADVEIAHRSTLLCHLANIAWRTKSVVRFDKVRETIVDNEPASQLMGRSYRKGFELPEIV
ncbi:MAG TPA: Gfo/Idh/MocA family oxidoreductase [Planctomycetaceae bacterium]|jgi:predicted dehydrogenase